MKITLQTIKDHLESKEIITKTEFFRRATFNSIGNQ